LVSLKQSLYETIHYPLTTIHFLPMSLPREQFETLALAQIDALYRMARRLTHDASKADDLVQDTFARALRSRDSFELAEYGIKPWLLRIMYNLHLNRAERDKRQPASTTDEALEQSGKSDVSQLPIDPTSFQAMDEQLVHALDALPVDYRTVMLLWAVEELSYKEIADSLAIPIGTVMSRLFRARQRLAAELKDYAAQEGITRE
jgi:RNA polymerase sigma-70 factor (ECF subfamily)